MRVALTWLLWAAPLLARADPFADLCERYLPPARVEVRATFAEPAISFELSAAQIRQLSRTTQPGVNFGLTQVETRVEQRVALATLRGIGDQHLCARPRIDLTLVLYRVRVHVARELLGDECAVAAVWHHELRHFAIYQESLTATAAELERLMRAYYDGTVRVGSEAQIREAVERELRERWASEIEAIQERSNLEHEALDARDASSDNALCDGALARLAARLAREAPP
jgi:hypothetical protein